MTRASGISRTWGSGPWLETLRRARWRDAWGKKEGPRREDTGESSKHGLQAMVRAAAGGAAANTTSHTTEQILNNQNGGRNGP